MSASLANSSPALWLKSFPFPQNDGHKYDRGSALVCGGTVMTGAARLAARAAQRVGAGLVTLAAPKAAYTIYAESLESVIVLEADSLEAWCNVLKDEKRNAILIGCGLGQGTGQTDFVLAALQSKKPCVLDADALTNFESNPEILFAALHAGCMLTPHEGEFARLFGKHIDLSLDRLTRVRQASILAGCCVLLKGHETIVAQPHGKAVVNKNAPPWLATAGSGDVLAGMIVGLLAQGMSPFDAACAAAWIHGEVANNFGIGLIAEDIVDGVPKILSGLAQSYKD